MWKHDEVQLLLLGCGRPQDDALCSGQVYGVSGRKGLSAEVFTNVATVFA